MTKLIVSTQVSNFKQLKEQEYFLYRLDTHNMYSDHSLINKIQHWDRRGGCVLK